MPSDPTALAPYRVLDLSTHGWWLCGRMLADLGADVLKIEPPGGDPGRAIGPFARGHEGDPDASLAWWFGNRGKRSAQLDLAAEDGRAELLALAAGADVVIESWGPGGLAAHGLDHLLHPCAVVGVDVGEQLVVGRRERLWLQSEDAVHLVGPPHAAGADLPGPGAGAAQGQRPGEDVELAPGVVERTGLGVGGG